MVSSFGGVRLALSASRKANSSLGGRRTAERMGREALAAQAMSGIMNAYILRAQAALPQAHPAQHLKLALSMHREHLRELAEKAVAARRAKRAQQCAVHPVVESSTQQKKNAASRASQRFPRSTSVITTGTR